MIEFVLLDAFASFREGMSTFMCGLLGIVMMVILVKIVIGIMHGDNDSVRKLLKWLLVSVIGFILLRVIGRVKF